MKISHIGILDISNIKEPKKHKFEYIDPKCKILYLYPINLHQYICMFKELGEYNYDSDDSEEETYNYKFMILSKCLTVKNYQDMNFYFV